LKKAGRTPNRHDLFIVDELPGDECSSTKVREALQMQNVEAVQRLCLASVAEYLLAHRDRLYANSSSSAVGPSGSSSSHVSSGYATAPAPKSAPPAVKSSAPQTSSVQGASVGVGLTPDDLRSYWREMKGERTVIGFYGHSAKAGGYRSFSNFFDQADAPFDFELPIELFDFPMAEKDRVVPCEFSEKAIMLCKAAAMGDQWSFDRIRVAKDPSEAKRLGRGVWNFDDSVWTRIVCTVGFQVVYQKFLKTPSIRSILLGTGDKLLAEATRNDKNWGIGIDIGDSRVQTPSAWQGSNILGWALMEARSVLRNDQSTSYSSSGSKAGAPQTSAKKNSDIAISGQEDEYPQLGRAKKQDAASEAKLQIDGKEEQLPKVKRRWGNK